MSDQSHVFEVTESDFQQQVIDASDQVPVLVDFWADWCNPCKTQLPVLLGLAAEYQGRFLLAKINTDAERALAGQQGIRSLPTLRLYYKREMVEELLGVQPESVLRALIDSCMARESDQVLEQALALNAQGERQKALELLEQAYQADPGNQNLHLNYARLCIESGQTERARELLDALPREVREQPESVGLADMVEFSSIAAGAADTQTLASALGTDPGQSELRYQLAARQVLEADYDAALDNFLELLKRDRGYNDGAAQRGLLAIFALLGDADPRVARYRRLMFTQLH